MWIASTKGFWSAVQANGDPDTVVVRTRVKADTEPVIEFTKNATLGAIVPEIVTYEFSDYPWRVLIPKTLWAQFVAEQAMDVDYGNFKDTVKARQGAPRAQVYAGVWSALLGLERLDPDQRAPKAPWWAAYGEDEDYAAPATETGERANIGDTCCGQCPGATCYVDQVTGERVPSDG